MIKWLVTQIIYTAILVGLMAIGWAMCYVGVLLGVL